ncbi:hypothetical protein AGMMS49938_06660 [Fibrobacterales bacterium]|nr:hypothetical protein AGMMS49938_06660 [Fibrobacterales bacterium]
MIEKGDILGEAPHPNTAKYPHQRVFYVRINGYVHYVPYVVEADGSLFLKTIIPSRAAMKAYGGKP